MKLKMAIAVTGASGSIYAKVLLETLMQLGEQLDEVGLVYSSNAKEVWKHELGEFDFAQFPFRVFDKNDFNAPFASGSAAYHAMIVCPCSMGTLGRIAHGISTDLITRAADVMLKERRKLILITREAPLNLIHINNMKSVTEAGGIICPASPSFYSQPKNLNEMAATVTNRALELAGIKVMGFRWGA